MADQRGKAIIKLGAFVIRFISAMINVEAIRLNRPEETIESLLNPNGASHL